MNQDEINSTSWGKDPHEIIHYATITTTIKSYSTDVYGPQQILRYDEQQSYTHKHTHTHIVNIGTNFGSFFFIN